MNISFVDNGLETKVVLKKKGRTVCAMPAWVALIAFSFFGAFVRDMISVFL